MVPGFWVTKSSVADLATDLTEKIADLDPANKVVLIQLLDDSCINEIEQS
jgi:hypothetical protein